MRLFYHVWCHVHTIQLAMVHGMGHRMGMEWGTGLSDASTGLAFQSFLDSPYQ